MLPPSGVGGERASLRRRPPIFSATRPCRRRRRSTTPPYNWTGFYVGINGGGGWGRSEYSPARFPPVVQHVGRSGRRHHRLQLSDGPGRFRPRRRRRLERHQRQRHLRRHHLRNAQRLARHRARPPWLCLRSLHALRDRRRGLRRHQDHDRRRRRAPTTPAPAGLSAAASKTRSPDRGPPRSNICMSISAMAAPAVPARPRTSAPTSCAPA